LNSNLVDQIRADRPSRPSGPIKIHPIQYAGKSVKTKLRELREACQGRNMIVTALDEIAWLFNLRGSDIHCCPVFFSYAIITKDTTALYIQSSVSITHELKMHLEESNVQIKDYDQILTDLSTYSADTSQPFIVNSSSTNMSIFQALKNVKIKAKILKYGN
jgi:Xaa-Pro aminopeptidase